MTDNLRAGRPVPNPNEAAQDLRDEVGEDIAERHSAGDRHRDRDGGIEMSARDRSKMYDQPSQDQTEREGDQNDPCFPVETQYGGIETEDGGPATEEEEPHRTEELCGVPLSRAPDHGPSSHDILK